MREATHEDELEGLVFAARVTEALRPMLSTSVPIDSRTGHLRDRWWSEIQFRLGHHADVYSVRLDDGLLLDHFLFDVRLSWQPNEGLRMHMQFDPLEGTQHTDSLQRRLGRINKARDESRAHELEAELAAVRARLATK